MVPSEFNKNLSLRINSFGNEIKESFAILLQELLLEAAMFRNARFYFYQEFNYHLITVSIGIRLDVWILRDLEGHPSVSIPVGQLAECPRKWRFYSIVYTYFSFLY